MKWILTIFLLLSGTGAFSQQEQPADLTRQITATSKTDQEKVKAIFSWITENISYNAKPYNRKGVANNSSLRKISNDAGDTSSLNSLNERVAQNVLRNRTALCEGYARLFTVLCDQAGIRSVIITGFANGNLKKANASFGVNHYWNAVFLDGEWHLLDVTWASGYVSRENHEFVREYDAGYFLTAPEEFIKDHYPDDCRWTLLPETATPREFRYSPFRQKSFSKYSITAYYPKTGIIEVSPGDTLHFEIETADAKHDEQISPDLLIDSTIFSYSTASVFLKPIKSTPTAGSVRMSYDYLVKSTDTQWFYLMYNDDLILRYRIRMKKELARN